MHFKTAAHDPLDSYPFIPAQSSIHGIIHQDPFFPSSTTFGAPGTSTSTSHSIPT